ncbi:right-handed parallel beta-helix repeat-containing protein [Lachnoclostridium sp.]|uniref:right-handed parallel beta-helix repeat-containing protein n=1 Tax=Lachnoclostridium sp. TaxID=2028282 RepID=UPI0028A24998|nr:right-handed parallel beta-helix repeat-containing protein [Lachnoclostridium sp.]
MKYKVKFGTLVTTLVLSGYITTIPVAHATSDKISSPLITTSRFITSNVGSHEVSVRQSQNKIDLNVTVSTNATALEIQQLLDYNKNNEYNLTIRIPYGTYVLDRELRIYSNTTIIASSGAKLMKNHQRGALLANDMSKDSGGYTTTENITIDGGIWDSSMIANYNKGTESFRFIHATNVTVKNATIRNVPDKSHLITFAGVKNGTIENCKLYGYNGKTLKEAIQLDIVHDSIIVPSMQSSSIVYDDLPCDTITIRKNEIYNFPRGIGSHTSVQGVFHSNITIENNRLHDLSEAAIKAYNYINTNIKNNTIDRAAVGILVYTTIENEELSYLPALPSTKKQPLPKNYRIVIEGNTIKNMRQYLSDSTLLWGDGIRIIGSKTRPLSNVSIKKNNITKTARYGIFVEYSPTCYIGSNYITDTYRYSICVHNSNSGYLYWNQISKAGAKGSYYGGIGVSHTQYLKIYKNTINVTAKNGIYLNSTVKNCNITWNKITGVAASQAIYANTKAGHTVSNNTPKVKK